MVRPNGDALSGYTITKSKPQLYEVLNDAMLYHNGKYADARVRLFARYFYDRLANKAREVMAEKLINDFNDNTQNKEGQGKAEKKGGKNKRKKRNKNKNKDEVIEKTSKCTFDYNVRI